MLKAIFSQIVVKPQENEEKKHGSIIIPDTGKDVGLRGEILSVGEGITSIMGTFIPTTLKVGQKVILPPMGPIKTEYEGQEYYICDEKVVLAVIE